MGKKLFDYVIGNPPYQEEQLSENSDGSLKIMRRQSMTNL